MFLLVDRHHTLIVARATYTLIATVHVLDKGRSSTAVHLVLPLINKKDCIADCIALLQQ
jgi:hypothetical protein